MILKKSWEGQVTDNKAKLTAPIVRSLTPRVEEERVKRINSKRMLVVLTVAPPTAGERVARTNKQRMLVVTTLAPPTAGERVARTNKQRMPRCHNSSPTYSRREGKIDYDNGARRKWQASLSRNECYQEWLPPRHHGLQKTNGHRTSATLPQSRWRQIQTVTPEHHA